MGRGFIVVALCFAKASCHMGMLAVDEAGAFDGFVAIAVPDLVNSQIQLAELVRFRRAEHIILDKIFRGCPGGVDAQQAQRFSVPEPDK